eukprot:243943_1
MKVDFVCNDLSAQFDILEPVGEGSYGVVTKCKRKSNGEIVAIKFIKKNDNPYKDEKKTSQKGLRIDIYREIQILNCLYDNDPDSGVNYDFTNNRITKLQQILIGTMQQSKYDLALIFEYYELSLSQIIRYHRKKRKELFANAFIAKILYQILEGLDVLHSHWIIHRDLKPSNILIDVRARGIVKLCDFGLSKLFQKYQTNGMHHQQKDGEIVTLYYRSPELFLTKKNIYHQSPAIDIWSIGCIFSELITLKALFKIDIVKIKNNSKRNYELLKNICFVMGLPASVNKYKKRNNKDQDSDEDEMDENDLSKNVEWNGVENLCYYHDRIERWKKYKWTPCLFQKKVKNATSLQKDLLKKVLMMDPKNRLTVKQAMQHEYFDILSDHSNGKKKHLLLYPDGNAPKYI